MSLDSCLELIESIKDYRVLFVGDNIQDVYHYVIPLGKSPKEYLIPVKYESEEIFHGGVHAAANHLRSFCKTVDVLTNPEPIRKVRMVQKGIEGKYIKKLFEVHYQEDQYFHNGHIEDGYDVVIVTDFGHGWITNEMISKLVKSPFLAVCTQTNASNIGFNLITKYPKADYIVIDEPEARLADHNKDGYIENVMDALSQGRCSKMIVTHGKHGAYGYQNRWFFEQPALSEHVLDTLGAGDAFFSVTAPMAKTGDVRDLLLIGCAAGALKCGIIGNRESVTKEHLIEFLKAVKTHVAG